MRSNRLVKSAQISIISRIILLEQQTAPTPTYLILPVHDEVKPEPGQALQTVQNLPYRNVSHGHPLYRL